MKNIEDWNTVHLRTRTPSTEPSTRPDSSLVESAEARRKRRVFDDELASKYLPELQVKVIYCYQTIWSIPWGIHEIKNTQEELKKEGKKVRPVQFVTVEGANHFVSDFLSGWSAGTDKRSYSIVALGKSRAGYGGVFRLYEIVAHTMHPT